MKKKINRIVMIICILVGFTIFLYLQNNLISITEIKITSSKIPSSFKGYKILQISDLHNKKFGDKSRCVNSKNEKYRPRYYCNYG